MAIKSLNISENQNPFAGFGGIVYGERFIGRKEQIRKIEERVLGEEYGNLAIMGLPRVGKSSLAYQAIMTRRKELISLKTIPILFGCGATASSNDFFIRMVDLLYDELEFVCEDQKYIQLLSRIYQDLKIEYNSDLVQKFFKFVRRIGYKIIYILDEFDSVQSFFEKADFQLLRELSYNPETHLCLVTCSRKTIEDIEIKEGAISNFAGVFSNIRLGMFSESDVIEYWEKFSRDWEISKKYKQYVEFYAGNHPYVMDCVNFIMYGSNVADDNIDLQFENVKLELMQILDNLIDTIEKENLLEQAIQLIAGPFYNVNQKEIEKLLKYEFIKKEHTQYKEKLLGGSIGPSWNEDSYICFSNYGTLDFYRRYYANVPYFALWSETENLLRSIIKDFLDVEFKGEWETKLRNRLVSKNNNAGFSIESWDKNIKLLKGNKEKMIKNFPSMNTGHLVDFTLTAQIFTIFIKPNWDWFGNHIFKELTQEEWYKKFDFLVALRNPISHNNPGDLEDNKRIGTDYCKEVSRAIRLWQQSRN